MRRAGRINPVVASFLIVYHKFHILANPMPSIQKSPKLLDQRRFTLRRMHYSYRTEQSYVTWVKRFILLHKECRSH